MPVDRRHFQKAVRILRVPIGMIDTVGDQIAFYAQAYGRIPTAALRYRREVLRVLAEVSFGSGALAVVGGTVVIVGFLTSFAGIELGLQGYTELANIGVEALSGFISAYINTRLAAPLIGGIALVATVGAGFTAQLGAMRVSEEIDAIEVMAVPSVVFLVTTRIIAGTVAIIPLYCIALIASYSMTRLIIVYVYGQASGAYTHYFNTFLIPSDIVLSLVVVIAMAIVVMSIHTYYGFHASGGPAGVGQAVGRSVRLSLIAVLVVNLLVSLAVFGPADTLHISG